MQEGKGVEVVPVASVVPEGGREEEGEGRKV
jgi:hypothetical protein